MYMLIILVMIGLIMLLLMVQIVNRNDIRLVLVQERQILIGLGIRKQMKMEIRCISKMGKV